jgi:hypothetical protein
VEKKRRLCFTITDIKIIRKQVLARYDTAFNVLLTVHHSISV